MVDPSRMADVLVVVDNSGSMAEEQQNLVENFLNQDPSECPLQDLANIPAEYKNPVRSLYTDGGTLSQCGFIQLLAAFENDFRVGVITTDVGLCDNRIPAAQGGDAWGFRPQRGCLQPDRAPGGSMRKLISAADLVDGDNSNDDVAQRFRNTLENIQTFGTPFERGLDAVDRFLHAPADERAPGCENDLGTFRRADASLVVIFLTDEEDCSHGLGGQLEVFGDENSNEVCGEFEEHFLNVQPAKCYAAPEELSPVGLYVDSLLAADANAKVAVIAGGVGEAGSIEPAGCRVGADGAPVGGDTNGDGTNDICFESGGLSNFTGSGQNAPCGPDTAAARDGLDCCVADRGNRYYEFADLVGRPIRASACATSYRQSLLDVAGGGVAGHFVEIPASLDGAQVLVTLTPFGGGAEAAVPRLSGTDDCAVADGYYRLEGQRRLVFCGAMVPEPGDMVGVSSTAATCPTY